MALLCGKRCAATHRQVPDDPDDGSGARYVRRHMEFDRLTVIPKASAMSPATYLDEDDANATSDGQLLSHLVGEVSEVGLDVDSPLYELKESARKSKSSSNKRSKKRSKLSKVSR